jgi:hypothetical protein
MLNVISSKRNEKKKINVKDIIKENSKTKQNECVSYEKKNEWKEKKIVLVLLTRVHLNINIRFFFFFNFVESMKIN